jgi:hypothetical protein
MHCQLLNDHILIFRLAFEGGGGDGGGHFYMCDRTTELNEHFGDLLHKIQDLEVCTEVSSFREPALYTHGYLVMF